MNKHLIRGIRYVPSLPTVLAQILSLLNDENSRAADLERIIKNDQALTSKVLAVANSAYYGFRYQILSVQRAVVALGYEEVRNICLGASLMGFLNPSIFKDKKAAEQLWLHSLAVAEATRLICEKTSACDQDISFTAGLLHDLGKVVLSAFFPEIQDAVQECMEKEGRNYLQAEKAQDAEHGQVGMALAEYWELPPVMGEVMAYHHNYTVKTSYAHLVGAVHVADYLSHAVKLGESGNPGPIILDGKYLENLGFDRQTVGALSLDLNDRKEAVLDLWQTLLNV